MLFVIAMIIEDNATGAVTLVQDTFVGITEDEALGKALKLFKDYGSVHSYKSNLVSDENVSEQEIKDLKGIDSQIVEFLNRGQKIQAIKRHRELTNYGLRESKEFIDNLISKHESLAEKYYKSNTLRINGMS